MKRSLAKSAGLTRYFSGKACPRGHVGERYVSTGQCALCLLDMATAWREENRAHTRQYTKERYWENPSKHNRNTKVWRDRNPERQKALTALWHVRNPLGRHTHNANRRAREKNAIGSHTHKEVMALGVLQKWRCIYCRGSIRKAYHEDHITALSRDGSNSIENIQLLCPPCNQRKYSKDPLTFARELGMLV